MARLRDDWTESLIRSGITADMLSIEIEPAVEPGPGISWNWWISFSFGDFSIDAIVTEVLETLSFENEAGYFEDEVTPAEVAGYLMRRAGV